MTIIIIYADSCPGQPRVGCANKKKLSVASLHIVQREHTSKKNVTKIPRAATSASANINPRSTRQIAAWFSREKDDFRCPELPKKYVPAFSCAARSSVARFVWQQLSSDGNVTCVLLSNDTKKELTQLFALALEIA